MNFRVWGYGGVAMRGRVRNKKGAAGAKERVYFRYESVQGIFGGVYLRYSVRVTMFTGEYRVPRVRPSRPYRRYRPGAPHPTERSVTVGYPYLLWPGAEVGPLGAVLSAARAEATHLRVGCRHILCCII